MSGLNMPFHPDWIKEHPTLIRANMERAQNELHGLRIAYDLIASEISSRELDIRNMTFALLEKLDGASDE